MADWAAQALKLPEKHPRINERELDYIQADKLDSEMRVSDQRQARMASLLRLPLTWRTIVASYSRILFGFLLKTGFRSIWLRKASNSKVPWSLSGSLLVAAGLIIRTRRGSSGGMRVQVIAATHACFR